MMGFARLEPDDADEEVGEPEGVASRDEVEERVQ